MAPSLRHQFCHPGLIYPPTVRGVPEPSSCAHQAPVVQTLDSAIHRINHYPVDKYQENQLRYAVDSDLSGGQRYPPFDNWDQDGKTPTFLDTALACGRAALVARRKTSGHVLTKSDRHILISKLLQNLFGVMIKPPFHQLIFTKHQQ